MKLLLPSSVPMDLDVPDGVSAVTYTSREPIPHEHRDAEAIVIWSGSPQWQRQLVEDLPHVRWVQTLSAGADVTLAAGFSDAVVITNGVGLHDVTVSEHALALILAAARRLDVAVRAADEKRWARELSVNQPFDNSTSFTLVRGSHIVIWGFGSIGQTLAGHLRALGAEVTGVARSAGERSGFPVVTADSLPEILPTADVLVSVLPSSDQTDGVIDAALLAHLPAKAWLVNVGRGAVVAEPDLIAALENKTLAGAALDVMSQEPLPPEAALWGAPNVILTPHSAGGRPLGAETLVAENLARFLAGETLRNVVDRD